MNHLIKNRQNQQGQALTALLIVMFVGLSIISAAVSLVDTATTTTGSLEEAQEALNVAETGVEDALLKLLRNPSFIGETLTVGPGLATINIVAGSPITVNSQGVVGNHQRNIQIKISFNSGVMLINSWKEM